MSRSIVRVLASDRIPTPSQQRAMDARPQKGEALVVALLGGYGSGKTTTGAEIALDLAIANRGQDGMIVAPTWDLMKRVTLPAFFDRDRPWVGACPNQLIAADRSSAKAPNLLLVDGSRIYLGSAANPGSLEGVNLSWFWGDEARLFSRDAWRVLIGRLRFQHAKRLQGVLTTTPSWGWLQEEFGNKKPGRVAFHMSTRENAANLADGFIRSLETTYSKRIARSLIEGSWGAAEHAVFGSFDMEQVHGLEWEYVNGLRTVGVVDFGRRSPHVTFWQQPEEGKKLPNGKVALDNTWVCFDELHPTNVSTMQLADLITEHMATNGYRVRQWFCDPAGNATTSAGLSDVHVMERRGFKPLGWCSDDMLTHIPNGVSMLDGMLLNTLDEVRMYFNTRLQDGSARGIVNALGSYSYPEPKNGQPISDIPLKDGVTDHAVDTARYLVINLAQREEFSGPRYARVR